jgi:broad specificity phosphatase PhoE
VKAVLFEIYLVLSGKMDSWFYDSPLSPVGLKQVEDLAVFLEKEQSDEEAIKILRADPGAPSSTFVCSNLRRAISTLAGGFRGRFKRRQADKILVLPSLQEIR